MCGAVLDELLHTFPCLGNMFIIQLPQIHNVTPQLNNFSRGIVLPNKSILALIPRIYAILRQGLKPDFSFIPQRERERLKLNNFSIYFFVLLHITKLNKII